MKKVTKLTDKQLVILNAAAARNDRRALPLPTSLQTNKRGAAAAINSLIKHKLLETGPAAAKDEVWAEDGDNRLTLVITDAGLAALGIDEEGATRALGKKAKKTRNASKAPEPSLEGASRPGDPRRGKPRPGTKLASPVDMLGRESGATVAEIMERTGWQAHSVRGAISGSIKKKLSLTVTTEVIEDRGRVYRIAPTTTGSKG